MRKIAAVFTCAVAVLLVTAPAAYANHDYSYTVGVTLSDESRQVNDLLTVKAKIELGSGFPANYSTKYEIVLCPDTATSTFADSFNCYAVSDAVQRNGALDPVQPGTVHPGSQCPTLLKPVERNVTAGERLNTASGVCRFTATELAAGVTVKMPPSRAAVFQANGDKARISVQSVKRYGDESVAGVGVHGGVTSPDPVCNPFCYIYNGTPRLVGEKPIRFIQ